MILTNLMDCYYISKELIQLGIDKVCEIIVMKTNKYIIDKI